MTEDDRFNHLLSKALERESAFELSQGFADRVVAMAEGRSVQQEVRSDRWWWIGGIVSLIGAVVFVLTKVQIPSIQIPSAQFTLVKPGVGIFTFFSGYSGLVIFGILFVTVLHVVDKLILRKQESG